MDALIDLLLDWVAQNTACDTAAMPHPAVVELSPELLTREFYSGIASLMPEDGVDERLNALFAVTDGPHGTIYILDADTIDGASHYEDAHENPVAREILLHSREHLAPYLKVRRVEFAELPKTISGKIRRVDLRRREEEAHRTGTPLPAEYRYEELL